MSFETDNPDSDTQQLVYPRILDTESIAIDEIDGSIQVVETSPEGILFIDTTAGVSFSIGREILIESSETVEPYTFHRNRRGHVVNIDLGPPPVLFRRSDLPIPGHRIDEMTRGLKFSGVSYRILHGERETVSKGYQSELFPQVREQQTLS